MLDWWEVELKREREEWLEKSWKVEVVDLNELRLNLNVNKENQKESKLEVEILV